MAEELLHAAITDVGGLRAVRQAGRRIAEGVRFDPQDQVRVATALSELARSVYSYAGRVAVTFLLERGDRPALVVEFGFAPRPGLPRPMDGDAAAGRLVDLIEEDSMGDGRLVRLRKLLPPRAPRLSEAAVEALRSRLAHLRPVPALEELRTQNAELIEALEDARRQREDLRAANAELEETNQGVMALYNELSEELENTNRGVVALHAELEEKSAQLRDASEAKNRFWANISHELRTPVNGIIGLSRLLLDPAADPLSDEQRHQISLIGDTAGTMQSLVNELLDMAKAEQGRLEPRPSPVAVPEMLESLAELLRPVADRSGPALEVDASGGPPLLVTDEVMLTRILRNLLSNGLKFTAEGRVRLTVRTAPGEPGDVEFVVSDTGPGIPPEERERVFEEFYQVPGTGAGGTGLGLPYALRLARTLGGDLSLDSVPGEGTTVTARIPCRRARADLGLGHVLIVGADEEARRTVGRLVAGAAERVGEAAGAAAAIESVAADPPDLVLLDPGPPEAGVADLLAAVPAGAIVVLMTPEDTSRAADLGMDRGDAVLSRGRLDPATLAEAIRLGGERRVRERE